MIKRNPGRPELLAPAGDRDAMRAAVANGADAVYFGLSSFSARQRATNFTLEELPGVIHYLHDRNVRGYVAFNTLIFSQELPQAAEYVRAIAAAGADAVIVQDLGLARLIHRMAPDLPIHASTQTTQTEPRGIEMLRPLGVRRVILARELSIEQIARIARATDIGLEVFVHGALCVSYSGQCLASEALWGRSANRGLCAQACRLPYKLVVDGRCKDLGERIYLVSMPDLAAWDLVARLAELGVAGLKIEGRLKSAEYVAAATRVYRAAIDAAADARPFSLPPGQQQELVQSFSRGFTHGFLDGADHGGIVHGRFARHLGVRVGEVVTSTRRGVIVELERSAAAGGAAIKPGDGVVFDDGRLQQDQQGGRVYAADPYVDPKARQSMRRLAEIKFRAGEVEVAAVPPGSIVWRTDDPKLRRELRKSYTRDLVVRRLPVSVRVFAAPGGELQVSAWDGEGNQASASWDCPLPPAEKHPLTTGLIREQFARLGQTPFELAGAELLGPAGPTESVAVLAPKSVLNALRRQVVEELMRLREARRRHEIAEPDALDEIRREIGEQAGASGERNTNGGSDSARLCVLVRTWEQFQGVLDWRPDEATPGPAMVYLDFQDARRYPDAVAAGRSAGIPVGLATPRVLKGDEERLLERIAESAPDAVLVRNLGALSFFRRRAPRLPLVGDYCLNVANEISAASLAEAGLGRLTPSCDLNFAQLSAMLSRISPALFEVVIHQHVPMFHMEHCVFAGALSRGRGRGACGRPCQKHQVELRDRIGEDHPLIQDSGCRNTVFNSHAQSAAQFTPKLIERGVRRFRVELLRESAPQVAPLLDCYARLIAGLDDGSAAWRRVAAVCHSHLTRGTLGQE